MSFFDRMTQKADELDRTPNEREALLKAIREENANMGKEEGRGARILTTSIALTVIVWAVVFLFAFVKGADWIGPTVIMLATVTGMYWGMYRETRERTHLIYTLVALVAMIFMLVTFIGVAFVK